MGENKTGAIAGLEYAAYSDVGMRRMNNQDDFSVALACDEKQWRQLGHLFLVADGMGGHAAGELASEMAAHGIPHSYFKGADSSPPDALREAFGAHNRKIFERGEANAEFQGMGTTCSALVICEHGAIVGHVGDSRVYRLRGNRLEQLSFDHSLAWEMRAAGQNPEALPDFLVKNRITRCVGRNPEVEVDLEGPYPLRAGDQFLLCSDGLTGEVDDRHLAVILNCLPPEEATRVFTDLANLHGGPDNITSIVVRISGNDLISKGSANHLEVSVNKAITNTPWALFGSAAVFAVVAIALSAIQMWPLAIAAGLLALALLIVAQWQSSSSPPGEKISVPSGKLGRGSYSTQNAEPDAKFVAGLAKLADELFQAAQEEHSSLDWSHFVKLESAADAAVKSRDLKSAVQNHCRAISILMDQLREGSRKDSS